MRRVQQTDRHETAKPRKRHAPLMPSVTITVRQGNVEEELVVPDAMLIDDFGELWCAFEHASKFKLL